MSRCHVIFAPYNYIVDPSIRSAMSINLKNSALLIDEAHNILESAREAASITMNQSEINEAVGMFNEFCKGIQHEAKRKDNVLAEVLRPTL